MSPSLKSPTSVNPLKLTIRRTSDTTYENRSSEPSTSAAILPSIVDAPVLDQNSESKPKITLSFKSLTAKVNSIKKKKKDKDRSESKKSKKLKKEKKKHKKHKKERVNESPNHRHSDTLELPHPVDPESMLPLEPLHIQPPHNHITAETAVDASEQSELVTCLPKLTFYKKGKHFSMKNDQKVSPIKLRLPSTSEPPAAPASSVVKANKSLNKLSRKSSRVKSAKLSFQPDPVMHAPEALQHSIEKSTTKDSAETSKLARTAAATGLKIRIPSTSEYGKPSLTSANSLRSPLLSPCSKADLLSDLTLSSSGEEDNAYSTKGARSESFTKLPTVAESPGRINDLEDAKSSIAVLKNTKEAQNVFEFNDETDPSSLPLNLRNSLSKLISSAPEPPVRKSRKKVVAKRKSSKSESFPFFQKIQNYSKQHIKSRTTPSKPIIAPSNFIPTPAVIQPTIPDGTPPLVDWLNNQPHSNCNVASSVVFPEAIPVVVSPHYKTHTAALPEDAIKTSKLKSKHRTKKVKQPILDSKNVVVAASASSLSSVTTLPNPSFRSCMQQKKVPMDDKSALTTSSAQLFGETSGSTPPDIPKTQPEHSGDISADCSALKGSDEVSEKTRSSSESTTHSSFYANFLKSQLGHDSENLYHNHLTSSSPSPIEKCSPTQNMFPRSVPPLPLAESQVGTPTTVPLYDQIAATNNSLLYQTPLPPPQSIPLPEVLVLNEPLKAKPAVKSPVMQGMFTKKKSSHSKKKRPHGCRNVPPQSVSSAPVSQINQGSPALFIKSPGVMKFPPSSEPLSTDSNYNRDRDPIKLKIKIKSPEILKEDFAPYLIPSSSSTSIKDPLGLDTNSEIPKSPGYATRKDDNVPDDLPPTNMEEEIMSTDLVSVSQANDRMDTSESPIPAVTEVEAQVVECDAAIVECVVSKQKTSTLQMEVQPKEDLDTKPKVTVPHAVRQLEHTSTHPSPSSESGAPSLSRPRSFMDKLSQLSQVLGVAPSNRLLEELPVQMIPTGRRDRFGRPLKRGNGTKGKNGTQSKVRKTVKTIPVKRQLRSSKASTVIPLATAVPTVPDITKLPAVPTAPDVSIAPDVVRIPISSPRPERPKRIPKRFLDATQILPKSSPILSEAQSQTRLGKLKTIPKANLKLHLATSKCKTRSTAHKPEDLIPAKVARKKLMQKQSRRLILRSRQRKRENLVPVPTTPQKDSDTLVLRSAHLPSVNDGRVTLTLRRSVLDQRDSTDKCDSKSDTQSVSSKTSKNRFEHNLVIDVKKAFEALYTFKSDGYASKIILKGARTLKPVAEMPLTKPPILTTPAKPLEFKPQSIGKPVTNMPRAKPTKLVTHDRPLSSGVIIPTGPVADKPANETTSSLYHGRKSKLSTKLPHPEIVIPTGPVGDKPSVVNKLIFNPAHSSTQELIITSNDQVPMFMPTKSTLDVAPKTSAAIPQTNIGALPSVGQKISVPITVPIAIPFTVTTSSVTTTNSFLPSLSADLQKAVTAPVQSKLIPKPLAPGQRALAPRPSGSSSQPVQQQSMVIIISNTVPAAIAMPPPPLPLQPAIINTNPTKPMSTTVESSVTTTQASTPEESPILHGFDSNTLPDKTSITKPSHSHIQTKPLRGNMVNELPKSCSVTLRPLDISQAASTTYTPKSTSQPVLSRTARLKNLRSARSVKGIVEDRDLILKRFLAMPELTSSKRSRMCWSSLSNVSSSGDSYCEGANNDWQVSYEPALHTAAILSESEHEPNSVMNDLCELGDSSYHTDESKAETEGSTSPRKIIVDSCTCFDCTIENEVATKGATVLAQGLTDPKSILPSVHKKCRRAWNSVYHSWRTDPYITSNRCQRQTNLSQVIEKTIPVKKCVTNSLISTRSKTKPSSQSGQAHSNIVRRSLSETSANSGDNCQKVSIPERRKVGRPRRTSNKEPSDRAKSKISTRNSKVFSEVSLPTFDKVLKVLVENIDSHLKKFSTPSIKLDDFDKVVAGNVAEDTVFHCVEQPSKTIGAGTGHELNAENLHSTLISDTVMSLMTEPVASIPSVSAKESHIDFLANAADNMQSNVVESILCEESSQKTDKAEEVLPKSILQYGEVAEQVWTFNSARELSPATSYLPLVDNGTTECAISELVVPWHNVDHSHRNISSLVSIITDNNVPVSAPTVTCNHVFGSTVNFDAVQTQKASIENNNTTLQQDVYVSAPVSSVHVLLPPLCTQENEDIERQTCDKLESAGQNRAAVSTHDDKYESRITGNQLTFGCKLQSVLIPLDSVDSCNSIDLATPNFEPEHSSAISNPLRTDLQEHYSGLQSCLAQLSSADVLEPRETRKSFQSGIEHCLSTVTETCEAVPSRACNNTIHTVLEEISAHHKVLETPIEIVRSEEEVSLETGTVDLQSPIPTHPLSLMECIELNECNSVECVETHYLDDYIIEGRPLYEIADTNITKSFLAPLPMHDGPINLSMKREAPSLSTEAQPMDLTVRRKTLPPVSDNAPMDLCVKRRASTAAAPSTSSFTPIMLADHFSVIQESFADSERPNGVTDRSSLPQHPDMIEDPTMAAGDAPLQHFKMAQVGYV